MDEAAGTMGGSTRELVVAGDITVDVNLARLSRPDGGRAWTAEAQLCAHSQAGGAALLAQVLDAVGERLAPQGITVATHGPMHGAEGAVLGDSGFPHAYALWSHFDDKAWRVQELLGVEAARGAAVPVAGDLGNATADVVVLDDAAFGMRDDPARWPVAITTAGARPWIVLKMQAPVASGALWQHLLEQHADRLIVIMTIGDLRRTEVQISRELSWERTAQDLVWELVYNPQVNGIAQCAHAVVSFGAAGAALLSRGDRQERAESEAQLVFDPAVIEGMWERERTGGMVGATVALTAGIVHEVLRDPAGFELERGVHAGLAALRELVDGGYHLVADDPAEPRLVFPTERVVAKIADPGPPFASVRVEDPAADRAGAGVEAGGAYWTILRDRYPSGLDGLALRIVVEGPAFALEGVPLGRFGKLLTVDRHEIEAFRGIRGLVAEYASRSGDSQMLSIAVFGSPGSGKSFGVKQVTQALLPPKELEILNFNVAQFDAFDDFADALRQVRDAGLRGRLPVVFWDEFDTSLDGAPLGWLRYFLAPMQDGEFQEGQIVHPIGRAVFVFAGGTASSMEQFRNPRDEALFRGAKGPDFVSRLRGFVNVLGPNPRRDVEDRPLDDPYFIVRRAILLRSMLERNTPRLLHSRDGRRIVDIDSGVLRAFLHCTQFSHGARSMESIIATSRLAGLSSFERSSLPGEDQLDLHVDGAEFLALVEELHLEGELLERTARAAHEVFCEGLRERGYVPGPENDETRKVSSALRPWAELREDDREASRANVRDIPNKLAGIGCVMVPARGDEPAFAFTARETEALARAEHERWCEQKRSAGWVFGSPTDKDHRVHEALVPWDDLSPDEREKDRDMVSGIPRVLVRAGYTILRSRRTEAVPDPSQEREEQTT
ncbi:MAG: RyR domain-containing protein [Acidimicrobiia bacterium]|jgi:hypothetical protein